jgi:hypothetical protein
MWVTKSLEQGYVILTQLFFLRQNGYNGSRNHVGQK